MIRPNPEKSCQRKPTVGALQIRLGRWGIYTIRNRKDSIGNYPILVLPKSHSRIFACTLLGPAVTLCLNRHTLDGWRLAPVGPNDSNIPY